jgi:hypothetical protein
MVGRDYLLRRRALDRLRRCRKQLLEFELSLVLRGSDFIQALEQVHTSKTPARMIRLDK